MTPHSVSSRLPEPPATVFMIGLGGIGMSALAQYFLARGYVVSGSDRLLEGPGRTSLMDALRRLGVGIFAQDGSGPPRIKPDLLVSSSAVEPDNPDLQACPDTPRMSRANALAGLMNRDGGLQIAVAGSAGKTSVTGWIASALRALEHRVLVVNGGMMREVIHPDHPGNFSEDRQPEILLAEVDESDKSLVAFSPDIGVLLNVGTDHHSRADLLSVFGQFLDRCHRACVLPWDLAEPFAEHGPGRRAWFGNAAGAPADAVVPTHYTCMPTGTAFELRGIGPVTCRQFGRHSALNAAAVAATVRLVDSRCSNARLARALQRFEGISQRFERVGDTGWGAPVYHDYAHNVQKIAAAIDTTREAAGSPLTVLFQPHGFKPLAFMRDALLPALAKALTFKDLFVFLPVYYAGGTAGFRPTAAEVAHAYSEHGLPVTAVPTREDAIGLTAERIGSKAVLVLGARDPSLPAFAAALCARPIHDRECSPDGHTQTSTPL